jgi:hypothetical protein
MRPRLLLILCGAAVATALGLLLVARTAHGSRPALARFSVHGTPAKLTGDVTRAYGVTAATLIGVREGTAFYRLVTSDGICYATGPAAQPGEVGGEACPQRGVFPSPGLPVLDMTVYEGDAQQARDLHAFRIEGFAADGVAAIEFLAPSGRIAVRVPVVGNVFSLRAPPSSSVDHVVALDSAGRAVATIDR